MRTFDLMQNNVSQLSDVTLSPENSLALCNFIAALSDAQSESHVYQLIAEYITALIQHDRTSATLLNTAETALDIYLLSKDHGPRAIGQSIPIDGSHAGNALRAMTTKIREIDLSTPSFKALYDSGLRCCMSTPIIINGKAIGTLNCASNQYNAYSQDSAYILEFIATLAATNIERQRMLKQLDDHSTKGRADYAEQLDIISSTGEALSGAMREVDVLSITNAALTKLLPLQRASFAQLDIAKACFHIVKLSGRGTRTTMLRIPLEGSALGFAYQEQRAIYEPNLEKSDFFEHVVLFESGFRSGWSIPVRCKGEITAFLNVAIDEVYDDSQHMTQVLEALVALIGSALERLQAVEQVAYQANYDNVTGLPNRHRFSCALSRMIKTCHDKAFALLIIDLDRFKTINDVYGHDVGDTLLKLVGERIRGVVRESDMVARFGGDEFVVLQPGGECDTFAVSTAQRILESLHKPFELEGKKLFVEASIGISMAPLHGVTESDLIKYADLAMYQAKSCGRNCHMVYSAQLSAQVLYQQELYNALHHAIENDELYVLFQPQFFNNKIIGVEALMRWKNPDLGSVSPADFIPLAEETRLINKLTKWVIHASLSAVSALRVRFPDIYVAVNISGQDCREPVEFVSFIESALKEHDLEGSALELEITENVYLQDTEEMTALFNSLKSLGVKLAIDDFGTGFSSLTYLNRIPLDTLKIDQSFVQEIETNTGKRGVVDGIITIANSLNIACLAEGVETSGQKEHLEHMGCLRLQGFHLSRPLTLQQFQEKYLSPAHAYQA